MFSRVVSLLIFALLPLFGEFVYSEKFIMELHPKDEKGSFRSYAGNTLQGIANADGFWFTLQTQKERFLILNIYNGKGDSIYSKRIASKSHGQDLSAHKTEHGYELVTGGEEWKGILWIDVTYNKGNFFYLKKKKVLGGYQGVTATLSDSDRYLVLKNIANKISISEIDEQKKLHLKYEFKLKKPPGKWFQGLAMKNGYIFCLYGGKELSDKKFLDIYTCFGKHVKRFSAHAGEEIAKKDGKKWELEGLTFKENALITSVMSGQDGHNTKRLYRLLLVD